MKASSTRTRKAGRSRRNEEPSFSTRRDNAFTKCTFFSAQLLDGRSNNSFTINHSLCSHIRSLLNSSFLADCCFCLPVIIHFNLGLFSSNSLRISRARVSISFSISLQISVIVAFKLSAIFNELWDYFDQSFLLPSELFAHNH